MSFPPLLDAETLTAHLDDPDWAVFDCRFALADPHAGAVQYAAGHIPGAVHLDLERDLAGPRAPGGGRHPLPDPDALGQRLGALGVGPDTQVVCYDGGELAYAARAWWLLRWLGHVRVAVLDGGFALWHDQGRPVSTERPLRRAPARFPVRARADLLADAAQILAGLGAGTLLVDARAPERFRGEREPLDPAAGHIPGAVNRPASTNLAPGGHLKPGTVLAHELRALLAGRAPEQVVCYCGSGVSACLNLLALEIAGMPGAKLYPGSWSEWCADPARPVERG
jgi:thiosulfate/3-mercaptopyruvate sulfurtransferase